MIGVSDLELSKNTVKDNRKEETAVVCKRGGDLKKAISVAVFISPVTVLTRLSAVEATFAVSNLGLKNYTLYI